MIALLARSRPPDLARARAMLAAAPHRGSAVTLRVVGRCVLGVATRPDAVDASVSADGPVVAALAGRLDNAAELSAALPAADAPASPNDADLVVRAFRAFGPDAPRRLRGACAGLVSDGTTLWCFRDHIGLRPLFYRDGPEAFVAASEPRQVLAGADLAAEPDFEALEQIMYGRMASDAPAALKGVARLAQASTLVANGGSGTRVRRYWHPADLLESARLSAPDVRDRFVDLLTQAVARSVSGRDVISLSGGLDSPAIAAFAAPEHRRRSGRPLAALSAVFPRLPSVDERRYIEIVAREFGIELHTYEPQARALDNVDEWCRRLGGPVPIVSVPEISDNYERARGLGAGTVLSGEFAEFVFGSPRHLVTHLLTHGRWGALARLLVRERRRGVATRILARHVGASFLPGRLANWYLAWRELDAPQRIPDWLDARKVREAPYRSDLQPSPRQRWPEEQLAAFEGSTITMEADELCAALAGVTVRRPFADIDLWEFFLSLPAEQKCPDLRHKSLVRGFMRGRLPEAILDRRDKTVFNDHVMSQVDYPTLKRLLAAPRHRIPGVDYRRLAARIDQRNFTRFDWAWAQDLARIHAFLNAW